VINLLSDTATKPTPDMLTAMMQAEVGDDVFGEDPSVNALEAHVANMFGHEAALFCPSGTMTNQLAIKVHTNALDEVICDHDSHIWHYESAGFAWHSGVRINPVVGLRGKLTANQVEDAIQPSYDWLARTRLVVLENTANRGGGSIYTLPEIDPIHKICSNHNLKLHLDGARLMNALVASGESTLDWGSRFDSISLCLSKGLGAPVGSVLTGTKDFIKEARRFRKVMGGGMRQAGYLAAAAHFALLHQVDRLVEDHTRAKELGEVLHEQPYVKAVRQIDTNIVIFDVQDHLTAETVLTAFRQNGLIASAFGKQTIRMVTYLGIGDPELAEACTIIRKGI